MGKKSTTIYWRKRYIYNAGVRLREMTQIFNLGDLAMLAELHGTRTNERYELVSQTVVPLTDKQVSTMVKDGLKMRIQAAIIAKDKSQRAADEKEFARLAKKLGR